MQIIGSVKSPIFFQSLACEKKTKKFLHKYGTENAVIKGKMFNLILVDISFASILSEFPG